MKNAPCLDCQLRHELCHSECRAYREYAAERQEMRHQREKKYPIVGYTVESIQHRRRNLRATLYEKWQRNKE